MSAEAQVAVAAPAPASEGVQIVTIGDQPSNEVDTGTAKPNEETAAPAAGSEDHNADVKDPARDEQGRFKKGVQERIDELTRSRREAEREAEYWKKRAVGDQPDPQANQPAVKPTRDNFNSDEEYLEKLSDWKVDQKLAQRDHEQKQRAESTSKAENWSQKLDSARKEIPDFDEVMQGSSEVQVAGHVAELIMEHEHGPKLMHHLAQNPDTVGELNGMSPAQVAFKLAKIGVKFDAPTNSGSSKPAADAVSKAPPPAATKVGAGRSTAPELGELSMDDYVERRRHQGASWAR